MILKLFTTDIKNIIDKYNEDITNLPQIKNNMVDILYYGKININGNELKYIITPIYETTFWTLKFNDMIKLSKNIVKTIKYIYDNNYFYNDLTSLNIGYDSDMNMIIIDYDTLTISKKLEFGNTFMPKYIINNNFNEFLINWHSKDEFSNMIVNKNINKFYSIGVAEILYHIFFVHIIVSPV